MVQKMKPYRDYPIEKLPPPYLCRFDIFELKVHFPSGSKVSRGALLASGVNSRGEKKIHSPLDGHIHLTGHWLEVSGDWNPNWEGGGECSSSHTPEEIIEKLREHGVLGMGGGMFPTYRKLKLSVPPRAVLINGCESEPLVSCDTRILLEKFSQVQCGMAQTCRAIGVDKGILIREEALYPGGYEKILIKKFLGIELGPGEMPKDQGVVVLNVQTARQIHLSVCRGEAQLERVTTVGGGAFQRGGNLLLPLGTPVEKILDWGGFNPEKNRFAVINGLMMGSRVSPEDTILAGTHSILALPKEFDDLLSLKDEKPCIRCGLCLESCPVQIPVSLYLRKGFGFEECILCGNCQVHCPSHRPLLAWIQDRRSQP